jgi:adenosylhomocysteine nucleosidase
MPKIAIVAALEREVSGLTRGWSRLQQEYQGRSFIFFERDEIVLVCGGIGVQAARRAAEAVIALYRPTLVQSVGFAGALHPGLRVGDVFAPAVVIDARDGSRAEVDGGEGTLVTFMTVAGAEQKANLARAYQAQAVDMEAAAVAATARAHGIGFAATKVISDELDFEMPGIDRRMDRFIDAQGRFRTLNFALFVALRPWLWRRVAMLAGNSRKAAKALGQHLERFRQGLSQPPGRVAPPPTAAHSTPQPAPTSGLSARSRE